MLKINNWLRQWQLLEPWERSVLLNMVWRLPLVWLLLRVIGFKRLNLFSDRTNQQPSNAYSERGVSNADCAQRAAQLCEIAAHHGLYKANCLHQSLALKDFLRSKGIDAVLRIGLKPGYTNFEAHAWVEFDGINLGRPIDDYLTFEKLSPSAH